MITFYIIELASLFVHDDFRTIVARSVQAALMALFSLLATYWWGRRGPPLKQGGWYLKGPSSNISRMNVEYYA